MIYLLFINNIVILMNIEFVLKTPSDTAKDLANRIKHLRLGRKWKQATLAERSGGSLASLRRFEYTGNISLSSLLRLALALGCLSEFEDLFQPPKAASISELENNLRQKKTKRGSL
jgi:transcriptional regulator with XRE-family HTH domain